MTSLSISFHPSAATELESAFDWYMEHSPRAANAFLNQLDNAIAAVQRSPRAWPRYFEGTRRYILTGFPFHVVYRISDSEIQIVAIAHGKRRPGYWRERT